MNNIFKGKKKETIKRCFGLLLAVVMIFNILPFGEFTVSEAEEQKTEFYSSEASAEGSGTKKPETDVEEQTEENPWTEAPETETGDTQEMDAEEATEKEQTKEEQTEKEQTEEKRIEESISAEMSETEEIIDDEQEQTETMKYSESQEELGEINTSAPRIDSPIITDLTVLGNDVINGGVTSGNGWSYDNGVLTLTNLTVTRADYPEGITSFLSQSKSGKENLEIHLVGNNVIDAFYTASDSFSNWSGIFNLGSTVVTLTGESGATLTINGWLQGTGQYKLIGDIDVKVNTEMPILLYNGIVLDNGASLTINQYDCTKELKTNYTLFIPMPTAALSVKNGSKLTVNTSNTSYEGAYACIYSVVPLILEDSTLTVSNCHSTGYFVYLPVYNYGNTTTCIINSTVNLERIGESIGDYGIMSDYGIDMQNSTLHAENTNVALLSKNNAVTISDNSKFAGVITSYFGSTEHSQQIDVYSNADLVKNMGVAEDAVLTIPEGASLSIPESVTLKNNGTMHIHEQKSLTGDGTLEGDGTFLIDVTADLIDIPDPLCYTGKELNDKITLQDSLEIMGKSFTADIDGWELDANTLGTVKGVGEYTAKYIKDGQAVEKTFTVGISATDISLKTYNGETETNTFTVDEVITVKAMPTATGKAPMLAASRATPTVSPTAGQMALFVGEEQVSDAVSAQSDGTYKMTINASDVLSVENKAPNGAPITLTAKFIGNSSMADAEATVNVNISAAVKVKTDSTITYYGTIENAWKAAKGGTPVTVTLLGNAEITTPLNVEDNDDITFDGEKYILSITSGTAISVIGGKLTIQGGTIKGDPCMDIGNANVTIKGGTFSGGSNAIKINTATDNLTLGDLLGQTETIHYAYYNESGIIKDKLEEKILTGTVAVKECTHDYTYTHTDGTMLHSASCSACGDKKEDEICSYSGLDTGMTGICVCGSTLTIVMSGANDLVYDGNEKTPKITITLDHEKLLAENNYKITYADHIKAGTATVTIVGEKDTYPFHKEAEFNIAPKSITVVSVALKDRSYNGENTVDVMEVTLSGIVGSDDVAVDLDSVQGVLSSANAGIYTSVMLPELILIGADKGNYTLVQPTQAVDTSVTISRLDTEIIIGTDTYNKTFGDAVFSLDVTSTNTETDVQYEVTEGEDVVSILNKTVTILSAGSAKITVSLPASGNYNAAESKVITVLVAKKGCTVDALDRSYFYLEENADMIDLAGLLPEDCGTVTYGTPTTSGNITWKAAAVDHDGKLSYTLASGNIDDSGIITVVAETQNYEDIIITINVKLINCDHVTGDDILYTGTGEKAPSCTEEGFGHKECIKCGSVMESGITVPSLGHDYTSEVTKEPTIDAEGERTYTCSRCGDIYTEPIPRTTPEGLWISDLLQSTAYIGSAIKPEGIRVYHGSTLLREKTEYTLSYKNNTKAGIAQVIVTGKGSYKGKATAEFTIEAVDLSTDTNISAFIATAVETGKKLKPVVTITWNGKKLKEKKDYTLSYDTNIKSSMTEGYDVTINGIGNYKGTIVRKFRVVPKGTSLLNSAKVTGIAKSYPYQEGKEIPERLEADLEKLSVKIGKTQLTKDDYTVRVENGNTIGIGVIVIEAMSLS